MTVQTKMQAARLHEVGAALSIDEIDTPAPRPDEILVRVRRCGIVPNLRNVLTYWPQWAPQLPLPPLPAIFGLDPAGDVAAVGTDVRDIAVGDRVYVNPGRSCGICEHCADGDQVACEFYTFNGYFGFSPKSEVMFQRYPYAGFAEYMTAPATAIVKLADSITFDEAARFGYLGTAYSGLRKGGVGPGSTVLINGCSGTLGLCAVLSALALGASLVLGTGRNRDLLEAVEAIAPHRIATFCVEDGALDVWVREQTEGKGVDTALDCLGPGAPHDAFLAGLASVRRGGTMVDIGGVSGDIQINVGAMMTRNVKLVGSLWFSMAEARAFAACVANKSLDMSVFEHRVFPLTEINRALELVEQRVGGFSNFLIEP